MLIECSFCHATANIPEDKEGAKVRCSECKKVYVAREKGKRGKPGGGMNPVTVGIGGGALAVILVFVVLYNNHKSAPPPAPVVKAPPPPAPVVDMSGWDSETVKFVRGIYDASLALNESALTSSLDGARIAKRMTEAKPDEPVDFGALDATAKQEFLQKIAQDFMRGEDEDSPHLWKPVDGNLKDFDLLDVTVRVTCDKRQEPGSGAVAESRSYDWKLARPDDHSKWKAYAWERYISDEEKRQARSHGNKKVTKVTLADGTSLFQAEMRHLDDYPDTTPEVHARVEKAIATMLDFSLRPKENNLARDELVAIGKPAIPQLLNKFYETKIVDTEDDPSLTQLAVVNSTLTQITGYTSGFNPLPGQTEERRTMALKAWFAWWERKGKNFTAAPVGKDLLEEMIVPTDKEKRDIEKAKAKSGG